MHDDGDSFVIAGYPHMSTSAAGSRDLPGKSFGEGNPFYAISKLLRALIT